ncbi:MAG: expansin EXLX1 family cellulose-binding protein [Streptosporangiaceae bacterium]
MSRGTWAALAVGSVAGGLAAAVAMTAVGASGSPACAGTGQATFYQLKDGGGNCSYTGAPADQLYVALGPSEYRQAGACGGYLEIRGPRGRVRAKIVDQCPECGPGHLDLSATAFARIADPGKGLVPVAYTRIVNPPVPPLSFMVRKGSSQYWLAVLVIDHGNPLTRVRASAAGRGWADLVRTDYNTWEARKGMGPGPFTFEVTDDQGHRAVGRGLRLAIGAVQATAARMYGRSAAPAKPSKKSTSPVRKKPREKRNPAAGSVPVPAAEPGTRVAASPC